MGQMSERALQKWNFGYWLMMEGRRLSDNRLYLEGWEKFREGLRLQEEAEKEAV